MSKQISCMNDLREYGINVLTGEACGLGYRILCDFTERGRRVLGAAFGIPNFQGAESWNGGTKEDPHVGSIMLAREMVMPIGIFALLELSGCQEVWQFYKTKETIPGSFLSEDTLYGVYPNEYDQARLKQYLAEADEHKFGRRRYAYAGTAGSRNQHVFSGRVS